MSKNIVASRRNIEFSASTVERIQRLRSRTETISDSEVIRWALKVADILTEELDSGKTILVRDKEGPIVELRFI